VALYWSAVIDSVVAVPVMAIISITQGDHG
jgi:hypothetical protein